MSTKTTSEVELELGVTYARLWQAIKRRKIPAPAKTGAGDYAWTRRDIERARRALTKQEAVSVA